MKQATILSAASLLCTLTAIAQERDSLFSPLDSVVVRGFSAGRLINASNAVGIIRKSDWDRFSPASSLSMLNTVTGVRMEERSPGSFRLAIRGSSLRSPFGVRNVRLYYNQLPFTDPGGNTYLNLFAPAAFNTMEILKGPAGSNYGAGTGGVLLAESDTASNELMARFMAGSYGLGQADLSAAFGTTGMNTRLQLHHQRSDGYRDQSAMKRTYASWTSRFRQSDRALLSVLFLYSDLFYETPGGLTRAQYEANPGQARPAGGPFPSAETAEAAISQRNFYTGISQHWRPVNALEANLSLYGAWAGVRNPSIRNYEKRTEPHYGGRLQLTYRRPIGRSTLEIDGGGEFQQGHFETAVYGNRAGDPDTLQTQDEIEPRNAFLFLQGRLHLPDGWQASAGVSYNNNRVEIRRVSLVPNTVFTTDYRGEWAPRFSVSRQLDGASIYALVSKGFSPPTTAELLPSTSIINTSLQAEWGWNYELGARGRMFRQRGWFDVNIFYFRLQDAIVQRRDSSGADYFENAGSTSQFGFEGQFRYQVIPPGSKKFALLAWLGYTFHPFTYDSFRQLDTDLSGKRLPGVARQVVATGLDLTGPADLNIHAAYQYVDPIWLNDLNTEKAAPYQLVSVRIGSRLFKYFSWFAGVDNLLDQAYSLGNDINAAAGRYYNAAPKRNYYAGITFKIKNNIPSRRARFR